MNLKGTGKKHFSAAAVIGEVLYFSDWWTNGLFCVNLKSNEVEILDVFESNDSGRIYELAFSFENEVWFIPRTFEGKIAIYNVENGNLEYLRVPKARHIGQYELFENYYIIGETVWLTPYSYDTVLKIDLKQRKMERLEGNIENFQENGWPKFINSCIEGKDIYLCPWGYDRVSVVDTNTSEIVELDLKIPQRTYRIFFLINNKLYLVPGDMKNCLLEYDLLTQRCEYIELGESLEGEYRNAYYDEKNQKLIFFPYLGGKIIFFDVHTKKSEIATIYINGKKMTSNPYWCKIRKIGRKIWVLAEERGFSELVYRENGEMETFTPFFPENWLISELNLMLKQKSHEKENVGRVIYERVSK